jgi:hypothetical protein
MKYFINLLSLINVTFRYVFTAHSIHRRFVQTIGNYYEIIRRLPCNSEAVSACYQQ